MSPIERKRKNTESKKSGLFQYIKTLWGALIEAGMLVVFATALYAVLLYFSKMLWNVYIATDVGQYYLAAFPIHAQRTINVLGRNLLEFSLKMTVLSFLVCMGLAVVFQLLHISRFLYLNRGMLEESQSAAFRLRCSLPGLRCLNLVSLNGSLPAPIHWCLPLRYFRAVSIWRRSSSRRSVMS
jgi:hypothetical protein